MYKNTRRFGGPRRVRNGQFGGRSSARHLRREKTLDPRFFVQKGMDTEEITYTATHKFSDFKLNPILHKNIASHGYTDPTPIQDQAIQPILEGRDVVGVANTGTGKTAAFLLPLITKVLYDKTQRVIIIAPTRELAVQIQEEFVQFAQRTDLFSTLCIGGVSIRPQMNGLRRNPSFVIGTPGRLQDLERQGALWLDRFNNVVLDEVDRMLDMGFVREISAVLSRLAPKRQSLFFSATLPDKVQDIMQRFLVDPVHIRIQGQSGPGNVDQDVVKLSGQNKVEVLHTLLVQQEFEKVLVFGRTKHGIEKLSRELNDRGFKVASIHGNKSQHQRQKALLMFKESHIQVLLATDVASRGLDIDKVSHVINYDQPGSYEDYIHRIGRTGRAGQKGKALTFID